MAQPGIELVRGLIARFFNGHDPDQAPEFFAPEFRWHGGSVGSGAPTLAPCGESRRPATTSNGT
jgi:hypothetical protein